MGEEGVGKRTKTYGVQVHVPPDECDHYVYLNRINKLNNFLKAPFFSWRGPHVTMQEFPGETHRKLLIPWGISSNGDTCKFRKR